MMRRLLASLAILAILCAPLSASGRVKTGTRSSRAKAGETGAAHKTSTAHKKATRARSTRAKPPTAANKPATRRATTTAARDAKGRIKRNNHARHAFMVQTGYPHGRQGYVIDHIVPLACGGADAPSNMQWQTVADAKVKDKTERRGC